MQCPTHGAPESCGARFSAPCRMAQVIRRLCSQLAHVAILGGMVWRCRCASRLVMGSAACDGHHVPRAARNRVR
jgi:hypothetical protein